MELCSRAGDWVVIKRFPAAVCALLEQHRIEHATLRQGQVHPLQASRGNVFQIETNLAEQWLTIWSELLCSLQSLTGEVFKSDLTQAGALLGAQKQGLACLLLRSAMTRIHGQD